MKITILKILILISLFGCKKKEQKIQIDNYTIKATELVSQILSKNIDCKCVIKPTTNTNLIFEINEEMPEYDLKKDFFKTLNISSEASLDSLIKSSDKFELTKAMLNSNLELIDRPTFDDMTMSESQKKRKALQKKCPCQYFISKPIFDREFKSAIVRIGESCGSLCSHGGYYIYRYKNSTWEQGKGFAFWIS